MGKRSKRYKMALGQIDREQIYPLAQACDLLANFPKAKFDETVDIALSLGVDARKAEQNVRGSAALPHGLGKKVRVIVFARGDKGKEAQDAGADEVGADELVAKVNGGFLDFDSVVATPDMMGQVGKLGKVLGPRGLMPSPKVGTVTFEVGDAVRAIKAGRAEFRVDKSGILHAAVGKKSFGAEKLTENLTAIIQAVAKMKPSTSKGVYLKSAVISPTMGPGVKVDLSAFRSV